jgi:hypothetical protein
MVDALLIAAGIALIFIAAVGVEQCRRSLLAEEVGERFMDDG